MRAEGIMDNGYRVDDCADVDVKDIYAHYGVEGVQRQMSGGSKLTGAGHSPDDEDIPIIGEVDVDPVWDQLDDLVEGDGDPNFHLQPIHAPKHTCPFETEEAFSLFEMALQQAEQAGKVPGGMGLLPQEWSEGSYEAYEMIRGGRKGTKEMRICLPNHIWLPRAEQWGRALFVMNYVLSHPDSVG